MKITLKIPIEEIEGRNISMWSYAEIEAVDGDLREAYIKAKSALSFGEGLPTNEYDTFIQNMIEGKANHIESMERLNESQRYFMQVIKRAIKRANYKSKKEEEKTPFV